MRITVVLVCFLLASLASFCSAKKDRKNKDSAYPCLRGDQCNGLKTFYKRRGARVCCEEGDKANVNAASNKCICRRTKFSSEAENDSDDEDTVPRGKGKPSRGNKRGGFRAESEVSDEGRSENEEDRESLEERLREQREIFESLENELNEKLQENQNERKANIEEIEKQKEENFNSWKVGMAEMDEKIDELRRQTREKRNEIKQRIDEKVQEAEKKYNEIVEEERKLYDERASSLYEDLQLQIQPIEKKQDDSTHEMEVQSGVLLDKGDEIKKKFEDIAVKIQEEYDARLRQSQQLIDQLQEKLQSVSTD